MANSFVFRQRVGPLDWKLVSSISIESILSGPPEDRLLELQSLLDPVTFCQFSSNDVRNNSVESVAKLFQFMQLLLEYLLNCQESQFKIIKDNNHRLSKSKLQIEKLKRDNTSMKEDIKIYQRQLNMLKHALSKSQGPTGEKEASYKQAPKVVLTPQVTYANTAQAKDDIIDSILLHEKETRAVMSSILDEQREMFLKQMSLLTTNLKSLPRPSQQDGDATKDTELERNRKMEEIISVQMNQTIDRLRGELQALASSANRSGNEVVGSVVLQELRSKELQMAERELQLKGMELEKREQQLQLRAESMNIAAGHRGSEKRHRGHSEAAAAIQGRNTAAAAAIIYSVFRTVLRQRLLRAFSWWSHSISEQQRGDGLRRQIAEQERLLQETDTLRRQQRARDATLEKSLSVEREKAFVAISRQHTLEREAEALKAQATESAAATEDGLKREKELLAALRSEKEKAFLAAARYNALVSKTEKDQALWEERLRMAEEVLAKHAAGEGGGRGAVVTTYSDSSVMTSMEQLPKLALSMSIPRPQGSEAASSSVTTSKPGIEIGQMASTGVAQFSAEVAPPGSVEGGEETQADTAAIRQFLRNSHNHWWLQEDLDESQLLLAMEERVKLKIPQRKKTQTDLEKDLMLSVLQDLTTRFT